MSCIPGLLEFNQLVMKEIHIHQPEMLDVWSIHFPTFSPFQWSIFLLNQRHGADGNGDFWGNCLSPAMLLC